MEADQPFVEPTLNGQDDHQLTGHVEPEDLARQQTALESRLRSLLDELEELSNREHSLLAELAGTPIAAGDPELRHERDQALTQVAELRARLEELEGTYSQSAREWEEQERDLINQRRELKEDSKRVVKHAQQIFGRELELQAKIDKARQQLSFEEEKLRSLEERIAEKRALLEQRQAELEAHMEKLRQREHELQNEKEKLSSERLRLARLRDSVDGLTGLYLRNVFLVLAEEQFKLARRNKRPFVLFFIDLDDLKRINDTFGHAEGDRAISATVKIFKKTFRESDIIARLGGDEFVVMAVEASSEQVGTLLGRLYANLAEYNGRRLHAFELSFSVGHANYAAVEPPPPDSTLDNLIAAADRKMYEHKRSKQRARRHPQMRQPKETVRLRPLPTPPPFPKLS
ncbi:MAG: diguanylate cyclase [Gemmataceae bacterium]